MNETERACDNIGFREADDRDIVPMVQLMNELGYEHSEASLTENLRGVTEEGGVVIVATHKSTVVGCICAITSFRFAEGLSGELVSVVVQSKYQGRGIGKGLVSAAERWLASRVDKVRVRANVIREPAHRFYQGLEYKDIKSQKVFVKNL